MAGHIIKPSIKGVLVWYALSALLIVGIAAFLVLSPSAPPALWALLIIPVALDGWTALKHIHLNSRRLVLDGNVLRYEDGLMNKKQRSLLLDKIRDVRTEQSFAQRLAGVGDLSVEALGESGSITLQNVDHPVEAAKRILDAMRVATDKGRQ